MEKATREQFLDCLQISWQTFVERFYSLPAQARQAFLLKQGYATFPGLLAHVIAWWQDGADWIAANGNDPTLPLPEIDTDAFNAAAVVRFDTMSKAAVIQVYESQRKAMVELIKTMPEAQLNYDNVNRRLYFEILGHWKEHELN